MATAPVRPGQVPADLVQQFVHETVDYAIFLLDPEGHVASWNRGAERIQGFADKEVVGRHVSVFYSPTDVAAGRPQYELAVAADTGRFEGHGWRVRKDGTMFWAHEVATAFRDASGRLLGFGKLCRDLTAERHAEEALRASEERFRLLTQSVRDYAIFMLDPDGRIASWNEGARHLKGYEAAEILGRHFRTFYTPEDVARRHPEHELEIAKAEGRYAEEGWRVRKDGSRFWASVTITALRDRESRLFGFAKVTRDLTARKLVEEELRERAESYAALNRELDAFSHTVAHDLRSPVRAVEHLSALLLEDEAARLSDEGRANLAALHASARSMARLVQDLLDLSTAGGREPRRVDVDVTRLARDVAADVLAAEPGRAIEVLVQDGLRAHADAHLVRVAIVNLVANAAKFTRRARAARIEVGQEDTPHGRAFFVRDNGVGFDPAKADAIFEPFVRAHSAIDFEGTGIGLATVRRVVERHGGRVWALGRLGDGATFYFTLPGASP